VGTESFLYLPCTFPVPSLYLPCARIRPRRKRCPPPLRPHRAL
jgi:hypothetical protein